MRSLLVIFAFLIVSVPCLGEGSPNLDSAGKTVTTSSIGTTPSDSTTSKNGTEQSKEISSNGKFSEFSGTSAVGVTKAPSQPSNAKIAVGVSSMDWLKAILGLVAVVVLIFFTAWFVKRFTGLAPGNQQHMRVISALPVGTRERIALISVADKQLLVGITQHNINLLHTFDEPVVDKNDKTGTDFATRLQGMLNKGSSV